MGCAHNISLLEIGYSAQSGFARSQTLNGEANVCDRANQVKPSARGELKIITLNDMYLTDGLLDVQFLGRGFAWLDTVIMLNIIDAANFGEMVQNRQSITISAPEENAFINGWIDMAGLLKSAEA